MNTYKTPDQILAEVRAIDPAISGNVDGCYITGTYRGKSSERYKFCTSTKSFVFNNAGRWVSGAFDKVIN